MYTYFPSCNFNKANPKTAKKLREYFKERMPIGICCQFDKSNFNQDDKALVICQACREVLEQKVTVESVWEYIDQDEDFIFLDYHGMKMAIQDCFRDRNQPNVHKAVRSILKKMNIEVIEIEENKENSKFCGTLHFESSNKKLKDYPDIKISRLPEELQIELMQEQVSKFPKDCFIICDCNRCLKGINLGGGNGVHLMELVMGTKDI